MSSNTSSNVHPSRTERRVTFARTASISSPIEVVEHYPSPLEAAIALSRKYIETLHSGVTTFLTFLTEQCLREYSEFFQSTMKTQRGSHLGTAPIPTSIKRIKLTLQPMEEVKESEGYKALHARLVAETEDLHRKWTDTYATVVDKWNCDARLRRYQKSVCVLLRNAAVAFIAQLGLQENSEDEIVMNLFATSGVSILSTSPPTDLNSLLRLYKETHRLANLPVPTAKGITPNIFTIIDEINQITRTNSTNNAPQATANTTPANNNVEETTTPEAVMPITCRPHISSEATNTDTPSSRVHGNAITPSTLGQSLLDNTIETIDTPVTFATTANATTNSPMPTSLERVPITYRGRSTHFTRYVNCATTLPTPTLGHTVTPQGDPPNYFHLSSPATTDTTNTVASPNADETVKIDDSSTSVGLFYTQNDKDLDQSLAEIDLTAITIQAEKEKIQSMIYNLMINALKNPINEYNACVTHRIESDRIKEVTTRLPMESLAVKVAAKVHSELPANHTVLKGLVREESRNEIRDLKRKLQSISDKFDSNDKKLKELKKKHGESTTSKPKNSRPSKNGKSGNLTWSRVNSNSRAAAVVSSTNTHNETHQQKSHKESRAAGNNATAAQRRRRNKNRLMNK